MRSALESWSMAHEGAESALHSQQGIGIDAGGVTVVTMKIRAAEESRGSYELLLVRVRRPVRCICGRSGELHGLSGASWGGDCRTVRSAWVICRRVRVVNPQARQEVAAINRSADRLTRGAQRTPETEAKGDRATCGRTEVFRSNNEWKPARRANGTRETERSPLSERKRAKTERKPWPWSQRTGPGLLPPNEKPWRGSRRPVAGDGQRDW